VVGRDHTSRFTANAAATGRHPRSAQAPRGLSLTRSG
jgi:hypothetical protein